MLYSTFPRQALLQSVCSNTKWKFSLGKATFPQVSRLFLIDHTNASIDLHRIKTKNTKILEMATREGKSWKWDLCHQTSIRQDWWKAKHAQVISHSLKKSFLGGQQGLSVPCMTPPVPPSSPETQALMPAQQHLKDALNAASILCSTSAHPHHSQTNLAWLKLILIKAYTSFPLRLPV